MKQTLNMTRQLAIKLRYCYSARRSTQNISLSRSTLGRHSRNLTWDGAEKSVPWTSLYMSILTEEIYVTQLCWNATAA